MGSEVTITTYLIAGVIAWAIGALPVAYFFSRINGVDIFSVGSRQAGGTNVFREVSRKVGIIVVGVDMAKGTIAILIARLLGLEGAELLVPTAAAVAGHWNSPFTKFRGGDGVSTLLGTALGISWIPVLTPILVSAVLAISLNRKLNHPSLWAGIFGYLMFIAISFMPNSRTEPLIVYGLTAIGLAIMLHSMYFHKRHKEYFFSEVASEEDSDSTLTQDSVG